MSFLICLPELTIPILTNLSMCIRQLWDYLLRGRMNSKQNLKVPVLGLQIPALCHSPGKLCLLRKLSSHFINLRNLQSAMFLSQGEESQTAPHTAQQRKPTRQLIEHLGALAK